MFEQVAPGTYTIRVTAVNDNNPSRTSVSTTAAQTGNLVVGEWEGLCAVAPGKHLPTTIATRSQPIHRLPFPLCCRHSRPARHLGVCWRRQ